MKVILLAGPKGSGKDTVADMLAEILGPRMRRHAFADVLREAAMQIFGEVAQPVEGSGSGSGSVTWRDALYGPSRFRSTEFDVGGIRVTPRKVLTTLGTEWGRVCIHPELWVRLTCARFDRTPGVVNVVTDARFANECALSRFPGYHLWFIDRPGVVQGRCPHASEAMFYPRWWGLRPAPIEGYAKMRVVNNGSLDKLRRQVTRLCAHINC